MIEWHRQETIHEIKMILKNAHPIALSIYGIRQLYNTNQDTIKTILKKLVKKKLVEEIQTNSGNKYKLKNKTDWKATGWAELTRTKQTLINKKLRSMK